MYKKKHKKTLKGELREVRLGTSGPKKQHIDEFSVFPLLLIYPRLGAKETANQETNRCKLKKS